MDNKAFEKYIESSHKGRPLNIEIMQSFCLRREVKLLPCSLCTDLCPYDGIEIEKLYPSVTENCIDCGICASACPTGAIRWNNPVASGFSSMVAAYVLRHPEEDTLHTVCPPALYEKRVELPELCPASLSLEHIILLQFAGIKKLIVYSLDCTMCPQGHALAHFARNSLVEGNTFFKITPFGNFRILMAPVEKAREVVPEVNQTSSAMAYSGDRQGRRDMFKFFILKVDTKRNIGLDGKRKSWLNALLKEAPEEESIPRRLSFLKLIIRQYCQANPDSLLVELNRPVLETSEDCFPCFVCSTRCPTGALQQVPQKGRVILTWDPSLCNYCGICWHVCPRKAIYPSRKPLTLDQFASGKREVLRSAVVYECPSCGKPFSEKPGVQCEICRKNNGIDSKELHENE